MPLRQGRVPAPWCKPCRNRSRAGVWSIFRPINSTSRILAGRKHGPDPLESGKIFHRVVNGYGLPYCWGGRSISSARAFQRWGSLAQQLISPLPVGRDLLLSPDYSGAGTR